MDLWHLKVFCKLVELKSFSKAGEAVRLSQPTVSSHIKELENYFGVQLVDRLARQAVPTKAGELLYQYAHRLTALRDEAEAAMAEFLGQIKGRLTIGGSTIPGGYILPRWIGLFARDYPQVQVALIVADTAEILSRIAEGELDIGMVGALSDDRRLLQVPLVEDHLCLAVPPGHAWARKRAVPAAALTGEPFIVREQGSGTQRTIAEHLAAAGIQMNTLRIVAELGSTQAVLQGIKNGAGISIVSTLAVADDLKAGALKRVAIEGLDLKRQFYLTRHRQRTPSPVCRAFVGFLRQQDTLAAVLTPEIF
ncbi:MAG: LysR family transcriptional regulator [Desulfobacterales bacterium]|nr:LysR family transcriptional regulator [Desulfobacterales bacterium]